MTVVLSDARNDFRRLKEVYEGSSLAYDDMVARADTLAKLTQDDQDAVPALAASYGNQYENAADSFTELMVAVVQEFSDEIRSDASSAEELLFDLDTWMQRQSTRIQVKSRGTVISAPTAGGSNVGDQTLYVNTKTPYNEVNEAASIETVKFELAARPIQLSALGQDIWDVLGNDRADVSEFDGPGVGIENGQMTGIGPGRTRYFTNPSFDQAFGSGNSKIPGITITAGEANIARDATDVAEARGGNSEASLKITGTCTMEIDFKALGISLSDALPYIMGLRMKIDSGSAAVTMTLGSSGASNPYTGTLNATTSWAKHVVNPDTWTGWRSVFDETGRPILTIEVTSVSSILWIDDLILDLLNTVGGVPSGIVAGLTAPGAKDYHESERTLTVGSGSVVLSSGAAGDTVDSITVDGVELLRDAVTFTTDLATTAQLVADEINKIPTAPNYEATASSGTITIKQTKPVAGTLTVASTVTDNGGGLSSADNDVTGGSLGELQDMCVRHTGYAISHGATATTGWED